ncbi:MAG: sensor histidine kinase [Actinomycetota bacterium]
MDRLPLHWAPHPPPPARAVLVAVLGPGLVTLLAVPETHVSETTVAVLYVLAVVLAAGLGGALAGIAASILSFLALNFFFTPPLHTFDVGTAGDLIALLVFLVVSVVVGLLLSAAVSEKLRAERREVEAQLLNKLTTRLLSGEIIEKVLRNFAAGIAEMFDLVRCELTTAFAEPVATDRSQESAPGEPFEVELVARGEPIGTMRAWPSSSRDGLDGDERESLEAFGSQLALALESMRLSVEVRRVEVDAETNRLKAALFSGVTHDVKTPLAAITASVTSLLEGAGFTPEESREHLETIKQEADRLHRVVNNMLDLSRMRADALVPSRAPSPVDELIESVVARLRPLLNGREVEISLQDELPDVSMDVVQIDQVLTNLIENAAKFSPPNSLISLSAVGHPGGVRVTVADRGSGIPKEDHARIFEPFERGRGQASGTGLGLAIARAIVLAHGGRIWVGDTPRGGAAFTFELPCAPDPSPEKETSGERAGARS